MWACVSHLSASTLHAHELLERFHDLDKVPPVLHHLVDVLVGGGDLVDDAGVLSALQPNRIPIRHQGAALHARARRMGQRESRTPASDALDWETSFGRGDATGLAILGAWTGWPYSAYAVIGAFAAFWAHKAVQHARTKTPHTTASPFMPWITTATNVAIAHALLARTAG